MCVRVCVRACVCVCVWRGRRNRGGEAVHVMVSTSMFVLDIVSIMCKLYII